MSAGGFVAENERKKRAEEEEEKKAIVIEEAGSTHERKKEDDEGERAYSDSDIQKIMKRTYDQKKEPEEPASTGERGLNLREKFSNVREKLADTVKRRTPSDEELQGKIARLRLKAEMEEQKARVSDAKMKRRANMMKSIGSVRRAVTPRPSGKGMDLFNPELDATSWWFGSDGAGGGGGMGITFNEQMYNEISGFSGMGGSPTTSKKQGSDADFAKMMLGDVSSGMGMGDMRGMSGPGFSAAIYNDIFVNSMGFGGGGKPQKGKKKKSMEQEAHDFFGF